MEVGILIYNGVSLKDISDIYSVFGYIAYGTSDGSHNENNNDCSSNDNPDAIRFCDEGDLIVLDNPDSSAGFKKSIGPSSPWHARSNGKTFTLCGKGAHVYTVVASEEISNIKTSCGMSICAQYSRYSCPQTIEILIVPGGVGLSKVIKDEDMICWLAGLCEEWVNVKQILSIQNGERVLDAAHLLKGFPDLDKDFFIQGSRLREKVMFVELGNVTVSKGVCNGTDVALYLVVKHFGISCARDVSNRLRVSWDPPCAVDVMVCGGDGSSSKVYIPSLLNYRYVFIDMV